MSSSGGIDMENVFWQCPYAPIYCYKVEDCSLCWHYLSLEIYGIQELLERLGANP